MVGWKRTRKGGRHGRYHESTECVALPSKSYVNDDVRRWTKELAKNAVRNSARNAAREGGREGGSKRGTDGQHKREAGSEKEGEGGMEGRGMGERKRGRGGPGRGENGGRCGQRMSEGKEGGEIV